jgi:hypothetical protein
VTWLAIVLAVASALTTAFSTSVQHLVAGRAPDTAHGLVGLLRHLVTRPWWVVGQALGLLAFAFHGAALHNGPIALVQPIVICGIVCAVPIRAAISRTWPSRRELGAVVLTAAALAAFLIASDPSEGSRDSFGWPLAVLVTGCAVAAYVGARRTGRIGDGTSRGFLLGVASGVMFGLVAVLLKATLVIREQVGWTGVLTTWPVYALVLVGLSGVAINQLAYRTARLSASMPVLNVVDGTIAIAFGYFVFHEVPRHDPVALTVEIATLPALFAGLWILARYEAEEILDIRT